MDESFFSDLNVSAVNLDETKVDLDTSIATIDRSKSDYKTHYNRKSVTDRKSKK